MGISAQSVLKWRSLGIFEECHPNKNKNEMSSDMESVFHPWNQFLIQTLNALLWHLLSLQYQNVSGSKMCKYYCYILKVAARSVNGSACTSCSLCWSTVHQTTSQTQLFYQVCGRRRSPCQCMWGNKTTSTIRLISRSAWGDHGLTDYYRWRLGGSGTASWWVDWNRQGVDDYR